MADVKVNGSAAIVDLLQEVGMDTPAKDVQAKLKDKSIDVSVPLINNVKTRLRQNKAERKKKRRVRVSAVVVAAPIQSEFDQMLAVKALAAQVGGFGALAALVEKTQKLAG